MVPDVQLSEVTDEGVIMSQSTLIEIAWTNNPFRHRCKHKTVMFYLVFLLKTQNFSGIIVPGGFDKRGIEGMINACKYARENKIPFLGT